MRVALSALTMAEYFRDVQEQDGPAVHRQHLPVHPGRPGGLDPLGACRPRWATSPPWPTRWASCRSGSPRPGAVRSPSMQAIYVPADDYTDPAPATTFAHLDATTGALPADLPEGIYPAVDPLTSTSRILDPQYVGDEHFRVANEVKRILQKYNDLQDIIAILGIDELSEEDKQLVAGRVASSASSRRTSWSPSSSPASRARRSRSRRPSRRSTRSPRASSTTSRSRRSSSAVVSTTWRRTARSWS